MKITALFALCVLFLTSCSPQTTNKEYIATRCFPHAEIFEDSGTQYEAISFDYVETPESTCFSLIGYDYGNQCLLVQFRDSGTVYVYSGVPEYVWEDLYTADSRGGFYNSDIKGQYPCEKIER